MELLRLARDPFELRRVALDSKRTAWRRSVDNARPLRAWQKPSGYFSSAPSFIVASLRGYISSQVPDEWMPRLSGVEFVRLSQADAVTHLAACGQYWILDQVRRTGDTVSLQLTRRWRVPARLCRVVRWSRVETRSTWN